MTSYRWLSLSPLLARILVAFDINQMIKPDGEPRDAILEAARRVFLRRGTAGARTREIATEAGVNNALVHYYFGTKAALADAVFAQVALPLMREVLALFGDPSRSLEEKIRQVATRHVAFHSANPWAAPYLIAEMHTHPERMTELISRAGPPPVEAFRAQVEAEVAAGRIRSVRFETLVLNLMSLAVFPFAARPMFQHVLGVDNAGYQEILRDRAEQITDLVLRGLAP